jgi:ElaB/YqjD/DUF883 family membrane-anchored ribosome-binding protein
LKRKENAMNETIHPAPLSDVPWPTSADRVLVPDAPMPAGGEAAPQAAVGLLRNAVQGAHARIDRLADQAEPAVQRLGERVSAAQVALDEKTEQLRQTRDAWAESVRCTVREKPLASLAMALALGGVIALLVRGKR